MNELSIRLGKRSLTRARRCSVGAALLGAVISATAPFPARAAFPPSAEGSAIAVATDHAYATQAALDLLHGGGNAFDGAIAAALTLGVVNPTASGLGGGGFALVYVAKDRKVIALDFREAAPNQLDVEKMHTKNQLDRGVAIGVPGEPAGLEWLSVHYGKKSLAADALPAAQLANSGFFVGHHLAMGVDRFQKYIGVSPDISKIFIPDGRPVAYRTTLRRPDLARTIFRFGTEGAKPFYTGDVAAKIVESAHAAGGTLSASDLAGYRVHERAPLTKTIDGRTIATMPAPSAGGLMLLEALTMYGADTSSPLAAMGFGSSAYLHTVAEVMRGAIADRVRLASDPEVDPGVGAAYEQALSAEQLAARRAKIDPNKVKLAPEFKTHESGTSHLIVSDAEGNVVSLTTTVNGPFGARVMAGDTGIVLNDELTDFSSAQDITGFGVIGLGPNRPRPGARPVSSMTPTIVLEGGVPILAAGGSGGQRIATGVTQATLSRLIFGMDAAACVSAPRIFVSGATPEILVESEVTEDVRAGLRARGEVVKDELMPFSAVQMVVWDRKGSSTRIFSASDPRKLGLAAAQ
jgi:gamma-glutamyltranspeptidase / glutathione hydrolase